MLPGSHKNWNKTCFSICLLVQLSQCLLTSVSTFIPVFFIYTTYKFLGSFFGVFFFCLFSTHQETTISCCKIPRVKSVNLLRLQHSTQFPLLRLCISQHWQPPEHSLHVVLYSICVLSSFATPKELCSTFESEQKCLTTTVLWSAIWHRKRTSAVLVISFRTCALHYSMLFIKQLLH